MTTIARITDSVRRNKVLYSAQAVMMGVAVWGMVTNGLAGDWRSFSMAMLGLVLVVIGFDMLRRFGSR